MLIATAGHVDHGKTSLIRALTGVDTDRLPEEKARGMTIDLGFASLALPDGRVASVVDVPGHERFIGNMIVGALGCQIGLLCVSAREGVSHQTVEHLQVLELLPVQTLVVALTFGDLASPDDIALVGEQVGELLAETRFAGALTVVTSATSGAGLDELKQALATAAEKITDTPGPWYLPIDRSFVVRGQGRVVTGSLMRGTATPGEAALHPGDRRLRVRRLQTHGEETASAEAVVRLALNLSGAEADTAARGDLIGGPGSVFTTERFDAALRFLKPPQHGQRVRVHLGADEVIGSLFLNDHKPDLAQIKLERPTGIASGQPLIIRRYSPPDLIGGGTVVAPVAEPRRKNAKPLLGEDVRALVDATPFGLSTTRLAQLTGQAADRVAELLEQAGMKRFGEQWMSEEQVKKAARRLLEAIAASQRSAPHQRFFPARAMATRAGLDLGADENFHRFLRALAKAGIIKLDGHQIARPDTGPKLSDKQRRFLDRLKQTYDESGAMPPSPAEVADELRVPLPAVQQIVQVGLSAGELVRLADNIIFTQEGLERLLDRARQSLPKPFTAAEFRDAVGTSRKYAIPLLEWMDARGHTVRHGDLRHWPK